MVYILDYIVFSLRSDFPFLVYPKLRVPVVQIQVKVYTYFNYDPLAMRSTGDSSCSTEIHSMVIMDHNTYEPLHTWEFMSNEHALR